MAPTATDKPLPRVSEHFPRVPAGCEKVADKFFACFYENGKQPAGESDANVGNRALDGACRASMAAYNDCVDAAAAKAPKTLFRVPEAYRTRE